MRRLACALFFHRLLGLLVLAVTLNALAFAHVNPDRVVVGTDSPEYDLLARQLIADRGFTLEADAPFVPTLWREPGYPLMLATIYRLTDANIEVVVAMQCVLLGLAAGVTGLVGARLFGPTVGLVGGALFGLSSESAHYAHWVLTEVPFTLLLLVTLGLALLAQAEPRARDLLAVGIGLGLAALVRAIALSLLPPLALVLGLAGPRWRRRWPVQMALVLTGTAVVVMPWVVRNWVALGRPTLTSRFGVNLVRRAPHAAEPASAYPSWIAASVWIATNPLSQVVYPISRLQWGTESDENLIWDFHVNDQVRYLRRYDPICQPAPDPDACYTQIGLAFVRAHPVAYMVQSAFELVKLLFAPLPGPQALLHNGTVWLGILSGALLVARRRLSRQHALLLAALAGYIGVAVLVDTQVRYLLPVLPIFAMFAALPVADALSRLFPVLGPALQRGAAPPWTPRSGALRRKPSGESPRP